MNHSRDNSLPTTNHKVASNKLSAANRSSSGISNIVTHSFQHDLRYHGSPVQQKIIAFPVCKRFISKNSGFSLAEEFSQTGASNPN